MMITSYSKLLVAALVVGTCAGSNHLRPMLSVELQEERTEESTTTATTPTIANRLHRFLQLDALVLNGLVDLFIPQLADEVEDMIVTQMDPTNIDYSVSDDQGEVDLNVNRTFCNATTAMTVASYNLGTMTGMATVEVTRLELVPNTANIDVSFGTFVGAGGATWEGIWQIDAKFVNFTASTQATLAKTFCNFTFEEILYGDSTVVSPTVTMQIRLMGETDNIYSVGDTSQVNSALLLTDQFQIGYTALVPNLGFFNDWVTLDANAPLIDIGNTGFAGEIRELMMTSIQSGIDANMPFRV